MNDAEQPSKPATEPMDSAMDTGAENEPALSVGDKHVGDAPDPNNDGVLTVAEAAALLGEPQTKASASEAGSPETAPLTIEGK